MTSASPLRISMSNTVLQPLECVTGWCGLLNGVAVNPLLIFYLNYRPPGYVFRFNTLRQTLGFNHSVHRPTTDPDFLGILRN